MGLKPKSKMGGAVYLLPNLVTSGNLFFGFLAMFKGLEGEFLWAASCIMLAAIFDVLDGRVARLTGATSEFGIQYDSLCDLVSFGVAPAFLMYLMGLDEFGRLGLTMCFVYMACGALRLARFNVQSSIGKAHGDFTGLPIPMAAGFVASFIAADTAIKKEAGDFWLWGMINEWVEAFAFDNYLLLFAAPLLGALMVSNIGFRSHKTIMVKGIHPFKLLVFTVALLALVYANPEILGFIFFAGYALSGPLEWLIRGRRVVEDEDIFESEYHGEAAGSE